MSQQHPLRYFVELETGQLAASKLRGREGLSRTWRFEAVLPLSGASFDPDAAVRRPANVVIASEAGLARRIHGMISECDVRLTAIGAPELRVVVEPALALARYRRDIRIFRDKDAVQIVEEVLGAFGIEVERRLSSSYVSRPYCVEMRESDIDFCQRLLQDEGIAYFVSDKGVVVLCDGPQAHEPLLGGAALPYSSATALGDERDGLFEVAERAELAVGRVSLRDFNPDHPSLPMDVSARVALSNGPELYDFPGEYAQPAEGQVKAQRFAESLRCAAEGIAGRTTCGRLAPGYLIELDGAPGVADGAYLVTEVEHSFERGQTGFSNRFAAVARDVPWRPLRETHVPQLPNPMTAFVTGPHGADVHTNEIGRVKVHFPWDRRQPKDDRCSDWVPVLQDNTGQSVAMPRIGWEVLVHFLEGDPDRPVVLGRMYNGADPFPEPLPEGKTRSALRSLSSPTRDGLNMLRFDDKAGSELTTIHAEKDQTIAIARDKRIDVGVNEVTAVGGNEVVSVGTDATSMVGQNRAGQVKGNQTLTVAGNRTLNVTDARKSRVAANHTRTIGASHIRRIESDDLVQVKSLKESVGALILETSVGSNAINAGMAGSLMVGGAIVELALKSKSEKTKLGRIETVGGLLLSKSVKTTTASSKLRALTAGGALSVTAAKALTFNAGIKMQISATAAAFAHPAGITLKVGGCSIVVGAGKVAITAPGKIVFRVSGANMQLAGKSAQI